MLEGLDRIEWARLGHAYGAASDVPGQIRALRSPDAEVRRKALWELYGNILHQGTRYEATAYAVPFLMELLEAPDTPGRADVAALVAAIAIGYDESWLPRGLPIAKHRQIAAGGAELLAAAPHPGDDGYDEDEGDYAYVDSLSREDSNRLFAHIAVAAYDAVRAGAPLLRRLLADPEPGVRKLAAYALAWFPEEAEASRTPLTVLAQGEAEQEAVVATALVALGLLDHRVPDACLADARPLVRWAAAVALARTCGDDLPEAALAELRAWAGGSSASNPAIPFLEGDLAGYAGLALGGLGPRHADAAFGALLDRIPSVSGTEALPVVSEALRLAFPGGPVPEGTGYAALDERQRRLVRLLADSPGTWLLGDVPFANFSIMVRLYGLPADSDSLAEYAR